MAISQNLQPQEIKYLKYLKGKGFNAKDSFNRLGNARNNGLFNNKTSNIQSTNPPQSIIPEKVNPLSLKGFYETGIKPATSNLVNTFTKTIPGIAEKTYEAGKAGIKRIGEAGVGLADGKYTAPEAFARGGAGALQTAFAPIAGTVGQVVQDVIPQDFKDYISKKANPTINDVKTWYNNQSPEQQRNLSNAGVGLEVLSYFLGAGTLKNIGTGIKQEARALNTISKDTTPIISDIKTKKDIQSKGVNIPQPITLGKPPVGPVKQGIVQGTKITPIGQIKQNIINKGKDIYKGVEQRIQAGPLESKGIVGQKQIITPFKKDIPKTVNKQQKKDISSLNKAFTPLQRVRGGKVVRPQEKIDNQWNVILNDFKKKNIKPTDMKGFRKGMINGQKDIYKIINPAIEKSNVKINLTNTLNEAKASIGKNSEILAPSQVKQINTMIDDISNNKNYYKMDMSKLENFKQDVNAITDWNAIGKDKVFNNFLRDLSSRIGTLQDNVLGKIEGQTGIKDLKNVYGAYSDMLGDVNKAIIKYDRKAPVGLFSGLGRIAGFGNIASGIVKGDIKEVVKGGAQIISGEVIKSINDANNIIKRVFRGQGKGFYGTPKKLKQPIKKPLALPVGKTKIAKNIILSSKKPIKLKAKVNKPIIRTTKSKPSKPVIVTPKKIKALPIGKRITPADVQKGIISDSKKELKNAIIGTTKKVAIKVPSKIKNIDIKKKDTTGTLIKKLNIMSKGGEKIQNINNKIRLEGKTEKGTIIPKAFKGKNIDGSMGKYLINKGYTKSSNGYSTTYIKGDVFVRIMRRDGKNFISVGKNTKLGASTYETGHRYKDSLFNELEYLDNNIK